MVGRDRLEVEGVVFWHNEIILYLDKCVCYEWYVCQNSSCALNIYVFHTMQVIPKK